MLPFLTALSCQLFFPLLLPKLQLLFFAPYLVVILYHKALLTALWHALFCGVIVDVFAATPLFGYTSINYVVTLLILHTRKHNFFEDKLGTIPLMTLLFSSLSTLFTLFEQQALFSPRWIVTDLFEMALLDATFAFIFFSLPFHLTKKIRKVV